MLLHHGVRARGSVSCLRRRMMVSPSSLSAILMLCSTKRFVCSFPTSRPFDLSLDHARRRSLSDSSILPFHSGRPRDALLVRWKPTARLYTATTDQTTKPKRENRRRNRRLSKRRNEEKQTEHRPSADWRHVTHGDHGRLIMTKERFENEASIQALNLDPKSEVGASPKSIVHNAKQAMHFKLRVDHVVRGPGGDQMFFATTTATMEKSSLSHVPDSTRVVKDVRSGKEVVELMTTGVARSKRHAEQLASVDLIAFLKECGVDLSRPPSPKPDNDWSDVTHRAHGRETMTQHRMENDPKIKALKMGQLPKQTIHNAKQSMLFQLRFEHVAKGRKNDKMYLATTIGTFDRSLLPNVPDSATVVKDNNSGTYMVELMATGVARSKGQAETLACVDLIAYLHECGVDARKPPNVQALRHMEEQERFKVELRNAQMLLELCHASRPHFETITSRNNKTTAKVTMYLDGQPLTAEASGPSIAAAQSKALVAASKSLEYLEEVTGGTRIQKLKKFIQNSPGGHVAALRINPLADEILDELEDSIGTQSDHLSRMERFAEMKSEFEASFRPRPQRSFRNNLIQNQPSTTNEAFKEEENARLKKATENPVGKQGKMKATRDALPITAIRQTLIDALQTNQVLVVSGGTGSGKSTQCPQYILEDAIANGRGANTRIVVTQPRRIAAISVAERVAAERDEKAGKSVGFSVRFNTVQPREEGGCIEFVTTGVLLRRLVNDPTLEGISHVMIDEVHERDIDTDFLLVLLKEVLVKKPELRVVLMSATLDAESFGTYFSREREGASPVPVMSVPSKPRHPVEVIHLEDMAGESSSNEDNAFSFELEKLAKSLLGAHDQQLQRDLEEADAEEVAAARLEARSFAEDEGEAALGRSDSSDSDSDSDDETDDDSLIDPYVGRRKTRVQALRRALSMRNDATGTTSGGFPSSRTRREKREIGDITVAMVAKIAQHVTQMETGAGRKGSILCFLPGWDEIKAVTEILEKSPRHLKSKMTILPLHSTIPQEDQHKVFEPAKDGNVKVILSTNIAESSVTIDDVLVVIDSGLAREMYYDAEKAMSSMETVPTSRASATQRLGRAGRVAPGKCYRIYSRGALEAMLERPMPEIQRTALEATCLQTCSMTNGGVENFLGRAMDPPPEETVALAMERLVKLGAINISPGPDGGDTLTPLGRCLSSLPLDPAIGRMLIMGCVMNCLDPVLTAAACFSSRELFYTPPGMRDESRDTRRSFCDTSDLMAKVKAYDNLQTKIRDEGWDSARQWASDNFISLAATSSIRSVRGQLVNELNRIGLVPNKDLVRIRDRNKQLREDASVNQNADNTLLYSAVWANGLPGNLSARRQLGDFGTLRTRMENHAGLHPSSVAFYRKPPGHKLPRWFLYDEMVLSSQVFLRGCTALEPEQIVLFGGYSLNNPNISQSWKSGRDCVGTVLDDWIIVEGQCQDTIDLLSRARREVNTALDMKVMKPRSALPVVTQNIIDAVCNVFDDREGEE